MEANQLLSADSEHEDILKLQKKLKRQLTSAQKVISQLKTEKLELSRRNASSLNILALFGFTDSFFSSLDECKKKLFDPEQLMKTEKVDEKLKLIDSFVESGTNLKFDSLEKVIGKEVKESVDAMVTQSDGNSDMDDLSSELPESECENEENLDQILESNSEVDQ